MSEDNENKSNNLEKGDQLVIGPRMKSEAAEKDESEIVRNPESEENHSKTDNSTTSSLMANLSRRRYLNRNDELRTAQLMKAAAENDPYEIKEVMARGAEAVLYRSVCGSFTFCAKAIRNNWNKLLGAAGKASEKLDNVAYRTKVRHIQNEFAISQMLNEDGQMPIVRIYSLRKVTKFGIELGYDLMMEYLTGHDLGDKVLNKVLPLEDKIRVMYQAIQALNFLHKKKIIHLDIKPSNFMLVNGKIKLIDFGVSVMSGYQSKAITGTGGYLSPEQICKDTIDERTDIFALGIAFGVFMGGQPLTQPQDELLTHSAREEARMHMNQSDIPALSNVPGLNDMPLIAEAIRNCTIMRRDKRMPSCNALLAKFREAAETYGIILN
ncbi:MAG: protein kinase [Victivallales bacterium]|nr:protein kinase [Victivallales bacterium]